MSTHQSTAAGDARSGRTANRLAGETSPYLLQHAHNPVEWWPWGPEAFAEARRRDVPVFLSVGYSTCYWCHVMERESFEDGETAALMNRLFVNVKVDREEHPDVDEIYMAAVQMLTGGGGWPMSVWLEPATLKPFWGGTYFPPRPAHGRPSFRQVLNRLSGAYADTRADVLSQAEAVAKAVREHLGGAGGPALVGAEDVSRGAGTLLTILDRTHGGFGGAPKFPQPVYLELLAAALGRAADADSAAALEAALRLTLDRMALGGVFDQVGGGFHRYSVDAMWLVPHFEKMLYDNAQLLPVYAEMSRRLGDRFYERTARRTFAYVQREMTSPEGAFYAAQDAEVDGREGLNYLWTDEEIRAALPGDEGRFAAELYGAADGPNFRDPHHPAEPARSVLRLRERPEQAAARLKMDEQDLLARVDRANAALLAVRNARRQPRLDDKVLTAWNGLMISGLARAGRALDDSAMLDAAERAARFLLARHRGGGGGLLRTSRGGAARIDGMLHDYAALAGGLLALHRAGRGGGAFLAEGAALAAAAEARFGDGRGGFFDTEADGADLFVRPRSTYDGAIPCGSSQMLHVLVDLDELDPSGGHRRRAYDALAGVSRAIADSPVAAANSTRALLRLAAAAPDALAGQLKARGAGLASPKAAAGGSASVVEVYASAEEVELDPETPAELQLRLEIAPGHHINSAAAAEESGGQVVPLRLAVVGGSGVRIYADFPAGEAWKAAGASHTVHTGVVEFPVALELEGDWRGEPRLVVGFQACTDEACLAPATVELEVAIRRAESRTRGA